ncbi:MAG: methylated-DNA--[protein]-cysteine S-methyltransferase [Arcobacter sp.]|nr:methylated-DNA--[protein]-cysteine S-methyltransferase [Arcobacter sp.]
MREYKAIKKNIIATTVIKTPIGDMFCAATNKGVCILNFFGQNNIEEQVKRVQVFFNAEAIPAHNKYFECLQKEINEYFEGKRSDFTIPLQLVGTSFQQSVWKILMSIPYGETITYKEEAVLLKNPNSSSAVANANSKNMISIIIPCHRVIKSDGKLGTYMADLEKKASLIKLENNYKCDIIRKSHHHEH